MNPGITIVHACLRDRQGGSATAVVDEALLSDAQRRTVPVRAGTSHAVFIAAGQHGSGRPAVRLRFFTAAGELPACGHGTVAALALLARRAQAPDYEAVLHAGGRTFDGRASRDGDVFRAMFDPGPVTLRSPAAAETGPILDALGLDLRQVPAPCQVASVGRPRMLVPVRDRAVLADLAPDLYRLRRTCDRLGLLGCYVYSPTSRHGHVVARMFAPSIGVGEDIANANSTACLAAHLAGQGISTLHVDMGDPLGHPATVSATARSGPAGPAVLVGGTAVITAEIA